MELADLVVEVENTPEEQLTYKIIAIDTNGDKYETEPGLHWEHADRIVYINIGDPIN